MKNLTKYFFITVLVAVIGFCLAACEQPANDDTDDEDKKPGATVSAPTLVSKTQNGITINAVAAPTNGQTVEYAMTRDMSHPVSGWQDERTFSGLTAGTTYYIFARSKENNTYNAGIPSAGLPVTTDWANINLAVANTAQWNAALDTIKNGGSGMTENPKNYTITVSGNVQVIGSTANSFGSVSYITVTLKGNGKLYLIGQGSLINIGNNQTVHINSAGLTLQGLRIGQNDSTQDNNRSVVYITGGTLELLNGTIRDNGGDCGMFISAGNFTMSGGVISGNGGGVFVSGSSSSFTMSGGNISGNTTSRNGGGVKVSGNFTMTGGTISGNNTGSDGYGCGGGVYFDGGSFTMSGGTISGNNAGSNRYGFNYAFYGGGVYFNGGSFTMSGGTISNNTCGSTPPVFSASCGLGGGVYVGPGNFTMTGGTINGNTASGGWRVGGNLDPIREIYRIDGTLASRDIYVGGGGVCVLGGSFTKSGGGSIYGNTATANNGDAVFYEGSSLLKRNAALGAGDNISTNTQTGWGQ